jgi:hypothetical protein
VAAITHCPQIVLYPAGSDAVILASRGPVLRRWFLVALLAAPGCVRVSAHQRAQLAAPAMQAPVWPVQSAADDHVHEVREGTGGAVAAGGGGCGCN